MAFASIKVQEEDKRAFDRLLHEVALKTGESVSQHELFHRIVAHALSSKDDLLAQPAPARRRWSRYQFDMAEETDAAADVDRVVYGLER